MKNSRKAKQYYTLKDKNLNDVQIDLNNYKVTCNVTGKRKSFYHKYLHNMIVSKYNSNIDLFREGYVSREAKRGQAEARKLEQVKAKIARLYDQIRTLKTVRDQLTETIS